MSDRDSENTESMLDSLARDFLAGPTPPHPGAKLDAMGYWLWWDQDGNIQRQKADLPAGSSSFGKEMLPSDLFGSGMSEAVRPHTLVGPEEAIRSVQTGGEIHGQIHYE